MVSPKSVRMLVALIAASTIPAPLLCAQPVWQEQGDAAEVIPGQETHGDGPLHMIQGQIESPNDGDLFRIWIIDPAVFRASTVGFASLDTQLFLFDAHGNGVTHNDDEEAGQSTQSTITGQFVPRAGIYYVGVTGYNKDPLNPQAALIWNNTPFRSERRPDGPGAPGPLSHWMGTGATGTYGIELRGVASSNGLWGQPQLDVLMDTCPGIAAVRWSNAPPNRQMGLVFGNRIGTTPISTGPCGGTTLGIAGSVQLVRTFSSGPSGLGEISGPVSAGACGRYLQLVIVDGDPQRVIPCSTSNPIIIQDRGRWLEVCQYQVVCLTDDFIFRGTDCSEARRNELCASAMALVGEFVRIAFGCIRVEDCPEGNVRGEKEFSIRNERGERICCLAARYRLRRLICGATEGHPHMPYQQVAPSGCTGVCP